MAEQVNMAMLLEHLMDYDDEYGVGDYPVKNADGQILTGVDIEDDAVLLEFSEVAS